MESRSTNCSPTCRPERHIRCGRHLFTGIPMTIARLLALPLLAIPLMAAAPAVDPAQQVMTVSRTAGTPDEVYGPLYRAVELAKVFPDSKTFADMIPRDQPEAIMAAYQSENPQ